jgi:nucleoredoxin
MKTIPAIGMMALLTATAMFADVPYHTKTIEGLQGALITTGGQPAAAERITQKKYLFIYFSAHWCPPCRAFTPKLVEFYNAQTRNGDFELLFISSDKGQDEMDEYMKITSMPWVAAKLGTKKAKALKETYGVTGIPCLVLIDENDQLLASSFEGTTYRGPAVALKKYHAIERESKRPNKE